ncbi:MAG: class D sortase [Candidatus Nomurabacteria bacterium]|jgi:sortase A|nr:class D sortase [Candidatus Nomurabacteria bacterium]
MDDKTWDDHRSAEEADIAERQRRAAMEIARKKLLANYTADNAPEYFVNKEADAAKDAVRVAVNETEKPATAAPAEIKASAEDIKKYHTAWQEYYQKYYTHHYKKAMENLNQQRPAEPVALPSEEDEIDRKKRLLGELRGSIRKKSTDFGRKIRRSRHWVPLTVGLLVALCFAFLQYNRNLIGIIQAYAAPATAAEGITALDPTITAAVGPDPKLIIPKINVEVPIIFNVGSDQASQAVAMKNGVAHFPVPGADSMPGQIGNFSVSGHSSNDVFSNGQYKFIFSRLEKLEEGDTVYVNYDSVRYTYKIVRKEVVTPTDVAKLVYPTDKPMLTLITCTPVGTAKNRLLVTGEQILPNPKGAAPANNSATEEGSSPAEMPANDPTFLENIWDFLFGN